MATSDKKHRRNTFCIEFIINISFEMNSTRYKTAKKSLFPIIRCIMSNARKL